MAAVKRRHTANTGIAKWRALGDYWFEGVALAAQTRNLPPVPIAEITLDNAVDVVTSWVRDGVTAVCAQSDEIACLVLYGMHTAGLHCPSELAVMGVDVEDRDLGVARAQPLRRDRGVVEIAESRRAIGPRMARRATARHTDRSRAISSFSSRLLMGSGNSSR